MNYVINSSITALNSLGRGFCDYAGSMFVQAGVLIVALSMIDLLIRKRVRATFRYWMWMLVFIKLVLPPTLSLPTGIGYWLGDYLVADPTAAYQPADVARLDPAIEPVPSATTESPIQPETKLSRLSSEPVIPPPSDPATIAATVHSSVAPNRNSLTWPGIAFGLWIAGVLVITALLVQRIFFVRGLRAQSESANGRWIEVLDQCRQQLGLRRQIESRLSHNVTSPAVCGLFRPVILVPKRILEQLSRERLRAVLIHELAHIKRGDLWINCVQTLLQIAYFYNPFVWLANAIVRRIREQAVDEMVLVALGAEAGSYSNTLIDVAETAFSRPALSLRLVGVVESKKALSQRIKHILNRPIPKTARLGILGLLVIIIAATILLPMAKSDTFGSRFGKHTLVRFSSNDKPTGTWKKSGDTTTYSKKYTVRFKEGEKLAIVAELYQVGKPMRNLGCRLFTGSEEPQELSVNLKMTHRNERKTLVVHDLKIALGNQILRLNDILVNTPEFFNNTEWHFFDGSEIAERERYARPYAEFDNLLRVTACPNGGKPRAPRVWIPTHNNVTWIDSDAYFISVNMLALSQLDNLHIDVPHCAEKMQLPDGTYLSGNSTKEERQTVAGDYLLSIKRALMREQMPLPELTAHPYYKVGDPIQLYVKVKASNEWKPILQEIYHDEDVNPVFFLIDGKEYSSRLGFGPFDGGGMTLHLPGQLYIDSSDFHLPLGRHTVAYGWKNVDVINPDEPNRVIHYDNLVTGATEFEVVEEIPADYYREIYEEGWEDILRRSMETPFTDDFRKGVAGALLGLKVNIDKMPFSTAFAVYVQAEGGDMQYRAGDLALIAGTHRFRMGCDSRVKQLDWDTVGDQRWRIILKPSMEVAKKHPPIRHYYGREFTTDWLTFERSARFDEHRKAFDKEQDDLPHYAGTIKADKPVDLDRLGRGWRGDGGEVWPLPDGFELGWSNKNGGTLRINPRSEVRMLWFPEANANLSEPAAETCRRLVELPDSRLTEINTPKGERTLLAVLSSESKIYFVTVHKVNETWANLSWHGTETATGKPREANNSEANTNDSNFIATLPNGVTVELVGIYEDNGTRYRCWRADGEILPDNYYKIEMRDALSFWLYGPDRKSDSKYLKIALRYFGGSDSETVTCTFDEKQGYYCAYPLLRPAGDPANWYCVIKNFPNDQSTSTMSFAIVEGQYKGYWSSSGQTAFGTYVIGKVFQFKGGNALEKNRTAAMLSHNLTNVQHRLMAADKNGKWLKGKLIAANRSSDLVQETYTFEKIEPKDVDYTVLQIRPYGWVTFKNVSLQPGLKTDVQIEAENSTSRGGKPGFGPVDFEGYFEDSAAGGRELEQLWNDRNKDLRDADEILVTVRKGLRRYRGSGNILRWIGNLFIWGKNPQNPKAIELMYHASGSPERNLYGDAIYFGLSVTQDKTPEILRAMTAVAMKTDDYYNVTGRILWGCRNQKEELIACLEPYLDSDDISVRQKAQDVKDYFMDSKAFMDKRAKQHEESVQREYGDKLGQFKDRLLSGNSQTRLDTLKQLNSKGVMNIVDESFLGAFEACTKDSDPQVRTTSARMMGNKFVWSADPQNQQAVEILTGLLDDPDRSARYAAVYYGLSTVRDPAKELVGKVLATIMDDREINYYGRVIWGIRRNKRACVDVLKEWMDRNEQDSQRALKAYEIYEDVTAEQLPQEYARRFAGQKSDAHEGVVTMCLQANPISKEELQRQLLERLRNANQIQKVLDLYIIETRETAAGMFVCANLADRNAIREALMKDNAFQVIGYLHGSIGPTGSGWIDSLENFRERNKHNRVALPTRDVPAENNQSSKAFSEPDKKDLYSMFMAVGTNRELVASALDKGDIETAAVA